MAIAAAAIAGPARPAIAQDAGGSLAVTYGVIREQSSSAVPPAIAYDPAVVAAVMPVLVIE